MSARIVAPTRRASLTRSSSGEGAVSGVTTNSVSPRRALARRCRPTRRCGGASAGAFQRTRVGASSAIPDRRLSSSRCAARCQGSSAGVPTRSRPPRARVEVRRERANTRARSGHPVGASKARSASTSSRFTRPSCLSPAQFARSSSDSAQFASLGRAPICYRRVPQRVTARRSLPAQRSRPRGRASGRCVGDVPPRGRGAHSGGPGGCPLGQNRVPGGRPPGPIR